MLKKTFPKYAHGKVEQPDPTFNTPAEQERSKRYATNSGAGGSEQSPPGVIKRHLPNWPSTTPINLMQYGYLHYLAALVLVVC